MPVGKLATVRNDAVRFEGVKKRFEDSVAVDGLDLAVPRGSVYGLLGPNGAGKTTSIRMLMGILGPDEGSILALGAEPTDATKDRIGYLPEERGLYPSMKVADNLMFFGQLRGLTAADARVAIRDWLAHFGMADTAGRRLQELSKGNQQKIQFVATVLHRPDLLVLDEPFSGLDPVNQDLMRATIQELSRRGTTIMLSTHRMDEVERLCSHLTLIHRGRAVCQGALDDVRREHGGESVHLEAEGDTSFVDALPQVASVRRSGRVLEVAMADQADPSALLAAVAPRVRVRRFEVRGASLHAIFVRMVSGPAERPAQPDRPAAVESAP